MTKLRLETCDAIVKSGVVYSVEQPSPGVWKMIPLGAEGATFTATDKELLAQLNSSSLQVEYDYFGDARAMRRERVGKQLVRDLAPQSRALLEFKLDCCKVFLDAKSAREVSLSDACYNAFKSVFKERVAERIRKRCGSSGGDVFVGAALPFRLPCRATMAKMLDLWEKTGDPAIFLKRTGGNRLNAPSLGQEVEAIIETGLDDYMHPSRPSIAQIAICLCDQIRELNVQRHASGLPELPVPSESTVRRRVAKLDKFEVCVRREGLAKARARYGPIGAGVAPEHLLQRVEMDEYELDVLAIMRESGCNLTVAEAEQLSRLRFWLYVVIDCASRCILSFKLSLAPSTADAIAALRLAMLPKTDRAAAIGCISKWDHCGHIRELFVDNGSAFTSNEFLQACADLGIAVAVGVGGVPHLRSYVERFFRTLVISLMPLLSGRVFSNPQERGDYPSEAQACLTEDDLIEILAIFIVDGYHNRKHRGLNWATPNQTWEQLSRKSGVPVPASSNQITSALGVDISGKSGRHGIRFASLNYHSTELAKHVMAKGGEVLEVRVDLEDISVLSCLFDGGWYPIVCTTAGLEGVSFDVWRASILTLRQAGHENETLSASLVAAAIKRIKETDAKARARLGLSSIKMTRAAIERAEGLVFLGVDIEGTRPPEGFGDGADVLPLGALAAEQIGPAHPKHTQHQSIGGGESDRVWRFSDED